MSELRARLGDRATVTGYGHVGDCNLHLNVSSKDPEIQQLLEPFVWDFVKQAKVSNRFLVFRSSVLSSPFVVMQGSISAEHGVGLQKVDKMGYSKSDAAIELIKALKLQFDPNLILNPYKIAPMKWD